MCPPVIRLLAVPVFALGFLCGLAVSPAMAITFGNVITVNSLADAAANDGQCTLREAITAANTDTPSGAAAGECTAGSATGRDSIEIPVNGTVTLTSALPSIASDVLIAGATTASGAPLVTVNGAGVARVFDIASGSVTLADLNITGGQAGAGGAIANQGDLFLTLSTVSGSTAASGGGIYNAGSLELFIVTVSGNSATGGPASGGGIYNDGTLTVGRSTFSGNTAATGGGILNLGTATITNTTISGNTSTFSGGGIFSGASAQLTVTNATITGNTHGSGGGAIHAENGGIATVVNTILVGNGIPDYVLSAGSPLPVTSIAALPAGKTLADVLVPGGPADNGNLTKTIALSLVAGNPAIDAGTASARAAFPVSGFDQRHEPRPVACDIGAYEVQPPIVAAHVNVSVAVSPPAPTVVTYTLPTAADEQGGVLGVNCNPPSGSTFAVGTTTVTCTATDAVGHTAVRTFNVIVSAIAAPSPPAPTLPNGATAAGRASAPSPQTLLGLVLVLLALLSLIGLVALGRRSGRGSKETG
jgi:CSLREA domain-containing protein